MLANNRHATYSFFSTVYPWLIVSFGMLFYCFNYFLRVSPSVMQPELTQAFHINATEFGALAGFYYYAYTPMQIPAGMIYDKFGVRFVLCAACLMAVMGLSIFITADNYFVAGTGRFMIGLGCAFAYIGTLKLASIWLPANRFATVAGLATAIGMISGALSQRYLAHFVELIGYQEALHEALIVGIVLSVILILFVRSRPKNCPTTASTLQNPINMDQLMSALRFIATNKQMWLIGIIGLLLYLPSSVFSDLWGIPYLQAVYNLTSKQAVNMSNCLSIGWIVAGPILGIISDKIKRRVVLLTWTSFFAAILLSVIFYVPGLSTSLLYLLFFLFGICCGSHSLCFALGKENNPIQMSGTAVAVTNMFIMLGGLIFQPLIGKLLDMHTTSIGANGLPIYTASDYAFAMSVIPIGVAITVILTFFLKETHCEMQVKSTKSAGIKPILLRPEADAAK